MQCSSLSPSACSGVVFGSRFYFYLFIPSVLSNVCDVVMLASRRVGVFCFDHVISSLPKGRMCVLQFFFSSTRSPFNSCYVSLMRAPSHLECISWFFVYSFYSFWHGTLSCDTTFGCADIPPMHALFRFFFFLPLCCHFCFVLASLKVTPRSCRQLHRSPRFRDNAYAARAVHSNSRQCCRVRFRVW